MVCQAFGRRVCGGLYYFIGKNSEGGNLVGLELIISDWSKWTLSFLGAERCWYFGGIFVSLLRVSCSLPWPLPLLSLSRSVASQFWLLWICVSWRTQKCFRVQVCVVCVCPAWGGVRPECAAIPLHVSAEAGGHTGREGTVGHPSRVPSWLTERGEPGGHCRRGPLAQRNAAF